MERNALSGAPQHGIAELFDEVCPYYLMAGMTYEQFWDGDPHIATYYRRKLEIEDFRRQETAWLYGYYDFVAVSTALANAFRDKGKRAIDYPKPPERTPQTAIEKEEKKRKQMAAVTSALESMTAKKRKGKGNGSS